MGGIDGCILLGNVLLELTIEIILGSTSLRFASGPVYETCLCSHYAKSIYYTVVAKALLVVVTNLKKAQFYEKSENAVYVHCVKSPLTESL